eukprot:3991510-Pyramimonas_sp.AAC.1
MKMHTGLVPISLLAMSNALSNLSRRMWMGAARYALGNGAGWPNPMGKSAITDNSFLALP